MSRTVTGKTNILGIADLATSGFFGNSGALSQYERVAWLSAQNWTGTAEQIGVQYAIWNVFDPGVVTSADAVVYEQEADTAAASGYAGFDFSGFHFIQETGAVSGNPGTEQAFVYRTFSSSSDSRGAARCAGARDNCSACFGRSAALYRKLKMKRKIPADPQIRYSIRSGSADNFVL